MICGVMAFKGLLEVFGAIQGLSEAFEMLGVGDVIVAFALPLLVGILTGYGAAVAGVAMPVIAGVSASGAAAGFDFRLISLAIVSSYTGLMNSPAHLCLPVTIGHFKADLGRVLQLVAVASGPGLLVALLLAIIM